MREGRMEAVHEFLRKLGLLLKAVEPILTPLFPASP
jgi:hypothetical protein